MFKKLRARIARTLRQLRRKLAKVLEPKPERDPVWDIPIDFCLRGAKALRDRLHMDEQDYLHVAGAARADCRAHVLYTALDEVKKTALYLMRLREFFDAPIDPRENRVTRLVFSQVLEEQQARERRLMEVLATLILFTTTNEQDYYRHLLLLEDLDGYLSANADMEEFHGARSANVDSSIDRYIVDIRRVEGRVDLALTWYQRQRAPLPQRAQLRPGGRLSSMRSRVKAALPLMTAQEKLLFGFSYAGYGAASEAVHYSVSPRDFLLHGGQEKRNISALGLLGMAILNRSHELIGRPAVPLIDQLRRMLEQSDPAEIVHRYTVRDIKVGDFVLAMNDLAEVIEVRESRFGYRSYKVRYLAEKPMPDIDEDWLQARFVRILMTRERALKDLQQLVEKGHLPKEFGEHLNSITDDELQPHLRKSPLDVWEAGLRDHVESGR
jgi:hypothetical protein